MKKLILKNSIGESYDLLNSNVMTFQLEGLGYTDESTYVRAGNIFVATDDLREQREIEFTALLYNNADAEYKKLVIFARKTPLLLIYENNAGEYRVNCSLQSISRVDRKGYDIYGISISLLCHNDFYKTVSAYNSGEVSGGKTYDYSYNYQYTDDVAESIRIQSETSEDSPCRIIIYGPCVNPTWLHYLNGSLIASGSMTGEIPAGRILVIDSTSFPFSITEQDLLGNLTADRYQACDFGTERFFFLQNGSNVISISHTDSNICPIKVEANISYASI